MVDLFGSNLLWLMQSSDLMGNYPGHGKHLSVILCHFLGYWQDDIVSLPAETLSINSGRISSRVIFR